MRTKGPLMVLLLENLGHMKGSPTVIQMDPEMDSPSEHLSGSS